jgi:hypothetical protein
MAQSPARGFQADFFFARFLPGVAMAEMEFEIVSSRKRSHEVGVGVGVGAANPVMKMCDRNYQSELTAQIQQQVKQANRIRAAGDSYGHTLARTPERTGLHIGGDGFG